MVDKKIASRGGRYGKRGRKGWLVKHSFETDFVDLLQDIQEEYPEEVIKIQGIGNRHLDIAQFSDSFFQKSSRVADKSIDSNANVKENSIISYDHEIIKPVSKLNSLYLLHQKLKAEFSLDDANIIIEKIINGELFVNDLTNISKAYCFAFELRNMMMSGLNFFDGGFQPQPPKRSDSFIQLVIQGTAYISNQIMGASSYPDFFPILDYFYRNEFGDDYTERINNDSKMHHFIRNQFQNLIYSLNWPFRGAQSPFTNLSVMDRGFLKELFDGYTIPIRQGGSYHEEPIDIESTYELGKAFMEYFSEMNSNEGIFTFPVMTIAISLDNTSKEYRDPKFVDWASEVNAQKSLANIFIDEATSFSSCCRLKCDFTKLADTGFQNSFGVGGLSIGSHRVAGLNLPRLSQKEQENPDILDENLDCLYKILYAHKKILIDMIDTGKLTLYSKNWMDLNRQYGTIGFVGLYEYLKNQNLSIESKKGVEKAIGLIKYIEDKCTEWQMYNSSSSTKELYQINNNIYNKYTKLNVVDRETEQQRLMTVDELYNNKNYKDYYLLIQNSAIEKCDKIEDKEDNFKMIFNIEQIPAESLAVRLADLDRVLGYNNTYELYSNQYIPLTEKANIYDRFQIQGKIDENVTGGSILHINVDDEYPLSQKQFRGLIDIAKDTNTRYFAINYAYSRCENNHFSVGKKNKCPVCNHNIESSYTRVVGFITETNNWNPVRRQSDWPNRMFYKTMDSESIR